MELNRDNFRAIRSYNFRRRSIQKQCRDELNQILVEAPSKTSIIEGMVSSIMVVVHSRTNFLKVFEIQWLFQNHEFCVRTDIDKIVM